MRFVSEGLAAFAVVGLVLILLIVLRPSLTTARGGKILAFLALFIVPVLITWIGTRTHLEHSKSTQFCLSCHAMEPYGRSLGISDSDYLPAGHYQNKRILREEACYTCHTTYTLFGDFQAKLQGMKHVYVNYLGTVPDTLELYQPYQNRECLHCHSGARTFEELEDHADSRSDLETNVSSCLDCHDFVHAIEELDQLEMREVSVP